MQGVGIGMRLIYLLKCVFPDLVSKGWGYISCFAMLFRENRSSCVMFSEYSIGRGPKTAIHIFFEGVSEKSLLTKFMFIDFSK